MQFAAMLDAPWREPAEVLATFAEEPWTIGFLSGGGGERARWSYLARAPDAVLVVPRDGQQDAFAALSQMIGPPTNAIADGPPFQGGVAGLASYELGDRVEPLGLGAMRDWPDLAVGRYPGVLAFCHVTRRVLAIGRGESQAEAEQTACLVLGWLDAPRSELQPAVLALDVVASNGTEYEASVAGVVARIVAGEFFQANIARSWSGRLDLGRSPGDLMQRLASQSVAPFASYFRLPGRAVVSNSPERFVRVDACGRVETRPIKGTRPRGRDEAEDRRLICELAISAKDRAENLMIVDLMRNDLSRVCVPGSVEVPELCAVETFTNVHHLVSTVTGQLAAGRTAIDLLQAAFPPGSITGAPKVQAMKLIAQLEPPRGPYCGTMFWAGCDGAFDSSVLIRTVSFEEDLEGWQFEARAGAGIVAESDPASERLETEAKIAALLRALTDAPT